MGVVTPVAEETRESQWGNLALLRLSAFGFGSNGIGLTTAATRRPLNPSKPKYVFFSSSETSNRVNAGRIS